MSLVKLLATIKNLQKLKHLILKRCMTLEYIPIYVIKLMALSLLDVEDCDSLLQVGISKLNLSRTISSFRDK